MKSLKSREFKVKISLVKSKQELLNNISNELKFPPWGENWDALDEMYSCMYWLDADIVKIYHEDVSCLPEADLRVYLSIMEDRKNTPENHQLYFYMNNDDVLRVESIRPGFFELEQVRVYHSDDSKDVSYYNNYNWLNENKSVIGRRCTDVVRHGNGTD